MILHAFSVYDVKADLYGVPFFMPSVGQAMRAFTDLANDSQSQVFRYPNEFRLERIGSFDDSSGAFVSVPAVVLAFANEVKTVSPQLPLPRPVAELVAPELQEVPRA